MKDRLVHVAVASCLAAAAHAATPAPVPEQLLACSKLQDESARVRCYDEQIAALNAAAAAAQKAATLAPAASASTPATASASPPAAPNREAAFGLPRVKTAPAPAPAPPPAAAAASSAPAAPGAQVEFGNESLPLAARAKPPAGELSLVSTITDIHSVGQSTYLISLANGQLWRQEGSSVTSFFRSGYEAKIEKAMMGSYQMSTSQTGEKNWVHVTRVR